MFKNDNIMNTDEYHNTTIQVERVDVFIKPHSLRLFANTPAGFPLNTCYLPQTTHQHDEGSLDSRMCPGVSDSGWGEYYVI